MIRTGVFDEGGEIELTSEFSIHVNQAGRNPRFLFDGNIVETRIDRAGATTLVRVEPDGRHRDCGFTGGLWLRTKDFRFHNGGGWSAWVPED